MPPSEASHDLAASKEAIGPEGPSPLTPYFLRGSDVIAAALLAGAFLFLSNWPLWHTDVWGHLKFGQWIVQHRRLPAQEPFLPFTDGQRCVNFYWLTQVTMYGAFAAGERLAGGDALRRLAGGAEMLALLFALVSFLRYLLLYLAYRRASGSGPLACLGLGLAVLVFSRVQRPQAFGNLCFAALLLMLSRPVLSRRALLLVPLCLVLWVNLHGSYVVGLAILGLFFLGRVIQTGWAAVTDRRDAGPIKIWTAIVNDLQVRRLFLAGLLSTAGVALLNPHGPWVFLYTVRFAQHPNIPSMVEWQPLEFPWGGAGEHWPYLATIVLVIATQIFSPRLLPPTSVLLCFTFAVFPLWHRRMMLWWIVLFPWIVLPAWAEMGRQLSWPWLHYRSQASGAKTLMAVGLLLLAVLLAPPVKWLRGGPLRPLERSLSPGTPWKLAAQLKAPTGDKNYYPQLADALKRGYPNGRFHGRICASETQGDYLVWALPPEWPVMVYTHVHLFSPEHWQDFLIVKSAEPGWREVLDLYGVNLIVVEVEDHPQLTEALQADADWRIVLDETGLQQKIDPRTRLLIAVRKSPLG